MNGPTLFAEESEWGVRRIVAHTERFAGAALQDWNAEDDTAYPDLVALWRILPRRCEACGGDGVVPEQHDYVTEYLACQDCWPESKGGGWLYPDPPIVLEGMHMEWRETVTCVWEAMGIWGDV